MKFRTEGLIIKEQNIGEQDKLVFALTKSNGVIPVSYTHLRAHET